MRAVPPRADAVYPHTTTPRRLTRPDGMDAGASCGVGFLNSGSRGTLDGWTMTLGQENADECAWLKGVTGGAGNVTFANGAYTFQGSWSNDTNVCALTHVTVVN